MINYLNFLSQEDEEVKEAPTHLVTYKWSNKVNLAEGAGQDPNVSSNTAWVALPAREE